MTPQKLNDLVPPIPHVSLDEFTDRQIVIYSISIEKSKQYGVGLMIEFEPVDDATGKLNGDIVDCMTFAPGVMRRLMKLPMLRDTKIATFPDGLLCKVVKAGAGIALA